MSRLVVGCMTGTSIDAIDAALVEIQGHGLAMKARFVRGASRDLGPVRTGLRTLADQRPMTAGEIATLANEFALLHAAVIGELLQGDRPDLVCIHGQTVYHRPPVSWQLMQPAPIAAAVRTRIVYDLRAADLAAGGCGAPITPLADFILYARDEPVDVVNLGGFCNITALPGKHPRTVRSASTEGAGPREIRGTSEIRGFDVCACNQLLDAISRATTGRPYDENGAAAARGLPEEGSLAQLVTLLDGQARSGRSLGTGDELHAWIETVRHEHDPAGIAATACAALGRVIGARIDAHTAVLAGGGVRNATLVGAIRAHAGTEIVVSDAVGIPAEYREAACFAVLGALCDDRVPITLPRVTGVGGPAPIAGSWCETL